MGDGRDLVASIFEGSEAEAFEKSFVFCTIARSASTMQARAMRSLVSSRPVSGVGIGGASLKSATRYGTSGASSSGSTSAVQSLGGGGTR